MLTRREIVKALMVTGSLLGTGVCWADPNQAVWNEAAFSADNPEAALRALWGRTLASKGDITLKMPGVVSDGSVVPVTLRTDIANVDAISLFVEGGASPLVAEFIIPAGTRAAVKTRIRLEKSTRLTAIVKAEGKLYSTSRACRVLHNGTGCPDGVCITAGKIDVTARVNEDVTRVRLKAYHVPLSEIADDEVTEQSSTDIALKSVAVRHQGKVVFTGHFGTAISQDAYIEFEFEGAAKADELTVSWLETSGHTGAEVIRVE